MSPVPLALTPAIAHRPPVSSHAEPPLSPLALAAATALGYLTPAVDDADRALVRLQKVWTAGGQPASVFAEFEAALVREGLRLRHQAMRHRTA